MISTNTNLAIANEPYPVTPIGLPTLCQMAFDGLDLAPVWNKLVHRVNAMPGDAAALLDLSTIVCHMAISRHWMIHYLNADMRNDAAKRAEEARFMANFDSDFGARHAAAFKAIADRSGLEYLPIDCAETQDGKLLVFEVGTAMIVHAMDPPDLFPYKRPQMEKVVKAFQTMLHNAARAAP